MRIFFSAGEASGDAYAAELLKEIKGLEPQTRFQGLGGAKLTSLGADIVANTSGWGAIGIYESLKACPKAISGYYRAKRTLAKGTPGVFIPIDFGYVNVRLSRYARSLGWQVLYFIPPGSWRRDKQGADLVKVTDCIVTPFPWSEEILRQMGANAHWFGHPIKQMISRSGSIEGPRESVAILPGSRRHEIAENLAVIAEAVRGLGRRYEVAVSSTVSIDSMRQSLERVWPNSEEFPILIQNDTYGVLKRARGAIVCSGTATLEAALCACPCVVIYRGSKIMELEFRLRKVKLEYFSLPNILAGRRIVPELLQWDATPDRINAELRRLLDDSPERQIQLEEFSSIDKELGNNDAITRTAELAVAMLTSQP